MHKTDRLIFVIHDKTSGKLSIYILQMTNPQAYIDGLGQNCTKFIVNVLELLQSWIIT